MIKTYWLEDETGLWIDPDLSEGRAGEDEGGLWVEVP
jgi:hypothetical protein